ncbi:SMP-30/gluconolactonase/LRE family protein [Nocardia paucivorans]|uniref:SMP-30/gluconolactonase/LRE family protein n=1 Tax=Nocardia paucivorans TaxID=114259 RepID=UPI00031ED341|nr:SMP-30/gluconolactonase/LRE family protein [Nocardia paucivorans]
MRPRGGIAAHLAVTAAIVVLTGCSAGDTGPDVPTREPATPALAPATVPPAGHITPTATPITALISEPGTATLAALDPTGTTLTLLNPATDPPTNHPIHLPAPAASITPGQPGEILAAAPGRILRIDAAAHTVTEIPVDGDLRSVRSRPDGSLVTGLADGTVHVLEPDGRIRHTIRGLVSADGIAVTGDTLAVLDRHQSAVTEIDPTQQRPGLMLRADDGAAQILDDPFGRVVVTDPDGGQLLVFTTEPLVLRQRYPVGSSPYALAYDQRSDTVWVTCTQSNEVVGYDLSTGIPEQVGRFPTVGQPTSVTVDDTTGDLFVGSAAGDGLQRIRADERKRGQ